MHQTTVWWPLFDRSARVTVVCREEPRWEHVPGPTTTLRQSASPSGAPSLLPCSSRVSCVRPSPSHFCEPHPLFPLQLMPATSPLQNPIASANPNPSVTEFSSSSSSLPFKPTIETLPFSSSWCGLTVYLTYPSEYGYQQVQCSLLSLFGFILLCIILLSNQTFNAIVSDFCKQAAMYSPQMASYYYQQLYGPTSPSAVGPPPYHHHYHPQMGYSMQSSLRAGSPSLAQGPRPPYMQQQQLQHPAPHLQG
ncbi:hypothetical protein GW17_00051673, partial [Ensete ventricosum]